MFEQRDGKRKIINDKKLMNRYNSTIAIKEGICKGHFCNGEGSEVPLSHKGKSLCQTCHQWENSQKQKFKTGNTHKSPIKKQSKKGAEMARKDVQFFKEIWRERPPVSEISGIHLGYLYKPHFMSHLLTKAAYPKFRHKKENIMLMTFEEHQEWEFGDKQKPEFREKFHKALSRSGELIIEYHSKN